MFSKIKNMPCSGADKFFLRISPMLLTILAWQMVLGQDDLILENMTISDSTVYEAANSITAGPGFVITETGKVIFKTGNRIYLRPGFNILSGGTFTTLTDQTAGPVRDHVSEAPVEFELEQNFPNPFNPSTTIAFTLPRPDYVTLKIYNILGAELGTLISDRLIAGLHRYTFDGSKLASGVYYYEIRAGELRDVRKMIILR